MREQSILLKNLNPEQEKAVAHKDGPLLIVAGAGTGKTTVITRRIAWLIEQKLAQPNEILALTFTEKAALEMEERVDRLLPYGYLDLWISTFHSFAKRLLDAHALDIGLPVNFRLLKNTELWVMMRQNLEKFDLDYYRPLGNPSRFLHALIKHFSRAKDELVTPDEYLQYAKGLKLSHDNDLGLEGKEGADEASRMKEVAAAYAVYQKMLLDNDALDFGDLITSAHKLFESRPAILDMYTKKFKYILIDEFQDTNFAQYQLIKLLCKKNKNITVVGDDDQSIYKFRGASVSNILKFKEDFRESKEITLTRNYRSYQNILDSAHTFIQQNNPDRLEQKLKISKKLVGERNGQGVIQVTKCRDYHSEALTVSQKISELQDKSKDSSWNDFAVLVRTNESAEVFMEVFETLGLPFLQVSRRGLYKKQIVSDVISYLRFLDNFHESRAMYRVLNFPKFDFTHDDLALLLQYANQKTLTLHEATQKASLRQGLSKKGQASMSAFYKLVENHARIGKEKPINELLVQVILDLEMIKDDDSLEYAKNADYLNQFNRKVQDFAVGNEHRMLRDFISEIDLELSAGEEGSLDIDTDAGPETIKIITVHSAKGLEFTHVFIAALADKKFPAIRRSDPIELPEKLVKDILPSGDFHIQEERRLFYVAMTRARDNLFLSYAVDYGGVTERKPSVFLKELGLVEEPAATSPTGKVVFGAKKSRSKSNLPIPKRFSFTSISDFRKCPLEYKHRHLLKVPEPQTAALSFGQTIHRTLENFLKFAKQSAALKQGELFKKSDKAIVKFPEFKKLKEFYEESWVDDWYEDKTQKAEYRKRGLSILENLYEEFKSSPPKPKYLEQHFKLGVGESLFTGKIDRADVTPEGLLIVDYKTGSGKKRPLGKVDKEQLLIYQWAAQDFLREKVAGLEYWFLKDGIDKKSFLGAKQQIEEVKAGLQKTVEQILDAARNDDFEKYHTKHLDCKFTKG